MQYCSLLPDAADAVIVASIGHPSSNRSTSRGTPTTTTTTTTTKANSAAKSTTSTSSPPAKSTTTEPGRNHCGEVAVQGEFSLPGLQSASPAQVSQAWCRLKSAAAPRQNKHTAICVVGFNQLVRVFEVRPREPTKSATAAAFKLFRPVCQRSLFWKIRSVSAAPMPPTRKTGEPQSGDCGISDSGRALIGLGGPCGVAVNVFCAGTRDFVSPKWTMLSPRCNVVSTQSSACGRLLAAISAAAHVLVWHIDAALCKSGHGSDAKPALVLTMNSRVVLHAKIRRVLRVTSIAFSPDSSCVAFGCWNDDAEEKGKWGRSGQVFVFRNMATDDKRPPAAGREGTAAKCFSPSSVDYVPFDNETTGRQSVTTASSARTLSGYPEWLCVGHTGYLEPDGETCAADGQLPESELILPSSIRASATANATVGGVWIPSPTLVAWTPDSNYIIVGNGIAGSMGTFLVGDTNPHTLNAVQLVSVLAHRLRLSGIASTNTGVLTWGSDGDFQLFPWRALRPMASAAHALCAAKVQRSLIACGLLHTAHLVETEGSCAENSDSECRHEAHNDIRRFVHLKTRPSAGSLVLDLRIACSQRHMLLCLSVVTRHRVVVSCRIVYGGRPVCCERLELPPISCAVVSSISCVEAAYDRWSSDCLLPVERTTLASKLDFLTWIPSASTLGNDSLPPGGSLHGLFRHMRVRSIEAWRGLQPQPDNCATAASGDAHVLACACDHNVWVSTHRSWLCGVSRPYNTLCTQHEDTTETFVSMVSPSQTVLYLAAVSAELSSDRAPPPSLTNRKWAALTSNTPIFRSTVVFSSKDGSATLLLVRAPNLLSLFAVPMPASKRTVEGDAVHKPVRKVFETEIPGLRQCHHDLQVCTCFLITHGFSPSIKGELPCKFGWCSDDGLPNTQHTVLFLQGNDANMPCHSALLWVLESQSCENQVEESGGDASAGIPGLKATLSGPWIIQDVPTAARLHFVACFAVHRAPRDAPQDNQAISGLLNIVLAFTTVPVRCDETSSRSFCEDRRTSCCDASIILFEPGRDHWTLPVPVASSSEDGDPTNCFDKAEQDFADCADTRFMRALLSRVRSELAKLKASSF